MNRAPKAFARHQIVGRVDAMPDLADAMSPGNLADSLPYAMRKALAPLVDGEWHGWNFCKDPALVSEMTQRRLLDWTVAKVRASAPALQALRLLQERNEL